MPEGLYFIQKDGNEVGPLTLSQMSAPWRRGEITVKTSFRYADESVWRPLALLQSELDDYAPDSASAAANSLPFSNPDAQTKTPSTGCSVLGWIVLAGVVLAGLVFALMFIASFSAPSSNGGNTSQFVAVGNVTPRFNEKTEEAGLDNSGNHTEGAAKNVKTVSPQANKTNQEAAQTAKTPNQGDNQDWREKTIRGQNWFGATSKELFEKLVKYSTQKDAVAFGKVMTAGLQTGETTFFKDGETVLLMDTAFFSGLFKVRRRGEVAEYWTNYEAAK